jgi:hypothetical protein
MIENNKEIDEFSIISTMNACFAKKDTYFLDQCYTLIIRLYDSNKNLSHTFWQTAIEGYMKCKLTHYVNNLLKLYPIKYSYSETTYKRVLEAIRSNEGFSEIFNIFYEKYKKRAKDEELRGYENIFNIFIDEMGNNL